MPLEGLVDPQKEKERLDRELKKVEKDLAVVTKKLGNPKFVEKAPEDVVRTERERLAALTDKRDKLEAALHRA